MDRTRKEIEHDLSLWRDRYRWAMEDVSKADNMIAKLKNELQILKSDGKDG